MLGSRYTRGAPPLVGMRMATPAVRAAPPAALLTACLAGGCDGGAAGARGRQPPSARGGRGGEEPQGGQRPRPAREGNREGRGKGFVIGGLDSVARGTLPYG